MSREQVLAETFVELADTLVDDYDVVDLMDVLAVRCVEILDAAACGLMVADPQGRLHVLATSTEQVRVLELYEIQNDEGPCLEAFRTGRAIVNGDLASAVDRWPRFAAAAREFGYGSVQAVPMRLRNQVIGALNLFHSETRQSSADDLVLAQALADVATIGILHARTLSRESALAEQLQGALNSRVIIEQAKGVVAERGGITTAEAFERIRRHARGNSLLLSDYARDLVDGRETAPTT